MYSVKQEPASPSGGASGSGVQDPLDLNIKREMEDWTLMTPEPIDIKPDITVLERDAEKNNAMIMKKTKRAKYPQFKNGIPCEPCKYTFPNYVKWLRHTKSHKHQRNIAIYEMNHGRNATMMLDPMNFVSTTFDPNVARKQQRSALTEVKQNPCPLGGCQASFKYRRNLVTHVKTHHGYRLKDLEARQSVTTRVNHIKATPNGEDVNVDVEEGQVSRTDGDERKVFKCSHCPKEFEYKSNLKNHLLLKHRISSISANLKCDRCFKRFYRKTGLLSHMRSCGMYVKSRKCPYCFMIFPTNKETMQHKSRCTKRYSGNENGDPLDPNSLKSGSNFSITPDEDGKYTCKICSITFEMQTVYCNHMEIYHAGTEDAQNEENGDELKEQVVTPVSKAGLEISKNDVPKLDVVVDESQISSLDLDCRYCTRAFTSVEELKAHWDYHDENKIFQCKLCSVTLNSKRYFQDHMRSHFIQHRGQYLCWTCFKPFNNRRALTAHKSMHIKVKCSQCKQTFNSIIALEKHKNLTHLSRETRLFDETLPESSFIGDAVKEDSVSEPREKRVDYNCGVCKKSFSCETALMKHSKLHNPVKFEVVKKFVQADGLANPSGFKRKYISVAKNSKGGRVQCDKCFSNFTTIMSLRKHKNMNRCPLYKTLRDEKYGNVKLYNCRYCRMNCQTVVALYRHLKSCNIMHLKRKAAGVDSNHCIKCRKQFSSLGVLFNHEKYCTVQPPPIEQDQQPTIIDDPSVILNRRELTISLVDPTKTYKCVTCSMVFNSDESLSRHYKFCKTFGGIPTEENVVTGERFYSQCNHCNRKFNTPLSFKLHKKFCSGGNRNQSVGGFSGGVSVGAVRCKGCARVFISVERLRAHEKVCKMSMKHPAMSVHNKQRIPSQQLFTCACGVAFTDTSALASHKESCVQQHYEVSSATGSTSSSVSSSAKSSNMSNRLLTCEYCFKTFTKYQAKNSHMRVCLVKLKVNPKKKKYTYRTQSVEGPSSASGSTSSSSNSYNCVVCKGSFNTEDQLIDHTCQDYPLRNEEDEVNNITVEPDINLEMFDLQPVQQQQLQPIQAQPKFIKLSQKKIYKCTPCNKIFSGSSALNKHSQIFHGQSSATAKALINRDGSIRCPKCPRNFRDHKSLTHHMGWHTRQGGLQVTTTDAQSVPTFPPAEIILTSGEPQYQPAPQQHHQSSQQHLTCPVCFRKFLGRGPLGNHIKTHANVLNNRAAGLPDGVDLNVKPKNTVYRCKICPKVFKDKSSLINHNNLHKTVNPAESGNANMYTPETTYVSCNICHKILSSNSIPRHNRMHRLRQEGIPDNFPVVNISGQQEMPADEGQQSQSPTLFPCGFCFKLFRYQKSLREHMKTVHNYNRDTYEEVEQYDGPTVEDEDVVMDEMPVEVVEEDVGENDDDVYIIDDNNDLDQQQQMMDATPVVSMSASNSVCAEEDEDEQALYKCEICDKSWRSRSVYLRHVNAPSHKELTKRLSDIITRVNYDVNDS